MGAGVAGYLKDHRINVLHDGDVSLEIWRRLDADTGVFVYRIEYGSSTYNEDELLKLANLSTLAYNHILEFKMRKDKHHARYVREAGLLNDGK